MEKITIKELIDFRRRSERSKKTFADHLKQRKKITSDSSEGGDYWVSCLSAINNVFKFNKRELLDEKVEQLQEKIGKTKIDRIKSQFQRNIDILNNFQEFDFQNVKPNADLTFHKKPTLSSIIDVQGYPIHTKPSHVFSFAGANSDEIGAVWFIAKLNGYRKEELGMFADILYRYLDKHFIKDYFISPSYCLAVDVYSGRKTSYEEIQKGEIPVMLDETIEEIKKT